MTDTNNYGTGATQTTAGDLPASPDPSVLLVQGANTRTRSITFDSLRVHAAKLPLEDKATLVRELKEQINQELTNRQKQAEQAAQLAKDL